jgi:hypothetical protein
VLHFLQHLPALEVDKVSSVRSPEQSLHGGSKAQCHHRVKDAPKAEVSANLNCSAQSCPRLPRLQQLIALGSLKRAPWASAMQVDAASPDKRTQKKPKTNLLFVHKTPRSLSLSNSRADSSSRRQINKHVQQTRDLGREQQERLERLEAPRIELFFNSSVRPQPDFQSEQNPPDANLLCNISSIEPFSNTLASPNAGCKYKCTRPTRTREPC